MRNGLRCTTLYSTKITVQYSITHKLRGGTSQRSVKLTSFIRGYAWTDNACTLQLKHKLNEACSHVRVRTFERIMLWLAQTSLVFKMQGEFNADSKGC